MPRTRLHWSQYGQAWLRSHGLSSKTRLRNEDRSVDGDNFAWAWTPQGEGAKSNKELRKPPRCLPSSEADWMLVQWS